MSIKDPGRVDWDEIRQSIDWDELASIRRTVPKLLAEAIVRVQTMSHDVFAKLYQQAHNEEELRVAFFNLSYLPYVLLTYRLNPFSSILKPTVS